MYGLPFFYIIMIKKPDIQVHTMGINNSKLYTVLIKTLSHFQLINFKDKAKL